MTTGFFNVDDKDVAFLKAQWDDLSTFYSADKELTDKSFQILKKKYSERGRFYHNLSHIKALLNLFESLNDHTQDRRAIRFSIWFHDAIYDTKRSDNEEESAKLASEMLGRIGVNIETIDFVSELILATKDHRGRDLADDAKLFLDIDLAILGMREDIYQEYSKAIRAEYSWVPELLYRRSRKQVLMSFIERESVYFTGEMQKRFGEQARKNINDEISSL